MRQRTPPRANRKVSSSARLGQVAGGGCRLSGVGPIPTFWSASSRVSFTISRSRLKVGTTTWNDTMPRLFRPFTSSHSM